MENTNGIENTAPKEIQETSSPGLNLNMEIENTETPKPTTRKPIEVQDLNDVSESDSDTNNDIDIDIGEEGPAVDHPLLDIDKDYDEDEEIDFSDELDHPSDEPIDIDSPSPIKPIEPIQIKPETEDDQNQHIKQEEQEDNDKLSTTNTKEVSEKLARAQNEFLDILKTLSASDMHSYFSWIDTSLKPHNVSIFGEPKRGPGRRKGAKKPRQQSSSSSSTTTTTTIVSERRPNRHQQKSRSSGHSMRKEQPRRRMPSMPTTTRQLICSPDSRLVHVNLRDVVNWKSFQTLLTGEEKDKLLRYIPPIDKQSLETLENMFNSSAFHSHLLYFQDMLEAGEFDKNNDDYKQYLIGKKKREQPVEEWKAKYYEEYWGQKKKQESEETTPLPVYSFTENAKPMEDAKVNSLNTIEDILAEFAGGLDDKTSEATSAADAIAAIASTIIEEEEEEMFEAPLEMLDDDFDEYSEDDTPKKKRKYKRKNHSDEEKPKPRRSLDKQGQSKRKKSSDGANSFRRCAHTILKREGKPLSAIEIVKMGIKEGMISTTGKTPQNTLASVLYCEMKKDPRCVFVKVAPMTFGLRTWGGNNDNYSEAAEPVKTRSGGNSKRRRKKQVEEESEESEEEEESDLSSEEESAEQQGEPIIINLSSVPPAEK